MFENELIALGLTQEQSEIYLSLLEKGSQSAALLAGSTSVKRTYVYKICEELIIKGLITQEVKGKTSVFIPQSPDHLLSTAEQKRQEVENAKMALERILPNLKAKYSAIDTKPVITYYEGVEGVKRVYRDALKEGLPIYALVQTSRVEPEIYEWVTNYYVRERVKREIKVKAIVSSGTKTKEYITLDEFELRETKLISHNEFPFEHEINIYGDKIALINHHAGEKLLAIIIENPIVVKTFKSWFELTWGKLG